MHSGSEGINGMLKVGVIGCGDIAITAHLPALERNQDVCIAALSSRQQKKLDELSRRYKPSFATRNYQELLQNHDVDAVIIATPPWVTPRITIDALKSGKAVLCEKPVAMNIQEAEDMKKAALEMGKPLMVGMTYRHDPLLHRMREWIAQGLLGSPILFRVSIYDEKWDPIGNPEHYNRIFNTLKHGSPSIHEGSHIFDWLHVLNKAQVKELKSYGFKSRDEFPESNYDITILNYEGGDRARVEIAWFLEHFPDTCFEAVGTKGIAKLDSHGRKVKLLLQDREETYTDFKGWWERCFDIQTSKFVEIVQKGMTCEPGIDDAIYTMRITEAIRESMKTGQTVRMPE